MQVVNHGHIGRKKDYLPIKKGNSISTSNFIFKGNNCKEPPVFYEIAKIMFVV